MRKHSGSSIIAGRYRLNELIAEGDTATIWRGTDLLSSGQVAVKLLQPQFAAQQDVALRFRRQARAAAKLQHPAIVQVQDAGVEKDVPYVVTEYLSEPDLKEVIAGWAPLPEDRVIDLAVRCVGALAHAHRYGVVHGGLKPENVLFTDDGLACLSDFGTASAAILGMDGVSQHLGRTPLAYYLAPEQIQGSPPAPYSDLYSLGCILYECLAGHPPFSNTTGPGITSSHLRQEPTPLRSANPDISPSVEFIVNKAMSRDVSQRYRSADEMLGDLSKVSKGQQLEQTGVLTTPIQRTGEASGADEGDRSVPARGPISRNGSGRHRQTSSYSGAPAGAGGQTSNSNANAHSELPWKATLAVSIVAIVVLVGLVWLVKWVFYPGERVHQVQVPPVVGEQPTSAREILAEHGLEEGEVSYQEDPMQEEGVIISQSPEAGETVDVASAVDLVINRSEALVAVVSVEDRPLGEARQLLEEAGLKVGEVERIYHSTVSRGTVIGQSITPGTEVEKGTEIALTVSNGAEPETAVTPPETAGGEEASAQAGEPVVEVVEDKTYVADNPRQRRFIVKVTVQGHEPGQQIEVFYEDDTHPRIQVLKEKMNPSETKEVPIITEGAPIIEVVHNGRVKFRDDRPAPAGASTSSGQSE